MWVPQMHSLLLVLLVLSSSCGPLKLSPFSLPPFLLFSSPASLPPSSHGHVQSGPFQMSLATLSLRSTIILLHHTQEQSCPLLSFLFLLSIHCSCYRSSLALSELGVACRAEWVLEISLAQHFLGLRVTSSSILSSPCLGAGAGTSQLLQGTP